MDHNHACMLSMIMWRKVLDEGNVAGAISTDFSKAFFTNDIFWFVDRILEEYTLSVLN